jgi:predicted GNAT family acetyltransferase
MFGPDHCVDGGFEAVSQSTSITHSESGSAGRYEARVEGYSGVGELTTTRVSPTRIVATHTGVDDSLRGTGVGKALVERLVADARKDGFTIVPKCSFIRALFRRHPDWADVMDDGSV